MHILFSSIFAIGSFTLICFEDKSESSIQMGDFLYFFYALTLIRFVLLSSFLQWSRTIQKVPPIFFFRYVHWMCIGSFIGVCVCLVEGKRHDCPKNQHTKYSLDIWIKRGCTFHLTSVNRNSFKFLTFGKMSSISFDQNVWHRLKLGQKFNVY